MTEKVKRLEKRFYKYKNILWFSNLILNLIVHYHFFFLLFAHVLLHNLPAHVNSYAFSNCWRFSYWANVAQPFNFRYKSWSMSSCAWSAWCWLKDIKRSYLIISCTLFLEDELATLFISLFRLGRMNDLTILFMFSHGIRVRNIDFAINYELGTL